MFDEEKKWLMDWKYGKILGMFTALRDQHIITKQMYDSLQQQVDEFDRYREYLENIVEKQDYKLKETK